MSLVVDVPTLLTFWWRHLGVPHDTATYLADVNQANACLRMWRNGHPAVTATINRARRDLILWQRDPTVDGLLPLPLSHPTR